MDPTSSRKTKQQELQGRIDAYRQRASEKALTLLSQSASTSSAAESIWLIVKIESKEYSFALKPVPVKLTYTSNHASNKHASVQTERYRPSALVPMQDMQWHHGSSHAVPGDPAGGATLRCTIVRSNKANQHADTPLRSAVEGTPRWQQQPTRLRLQAQGWSLHFHYSTHDGGKLRLTDAEYDTEMGEAALLSMRRLTAPPPAAATRGGHATKRRKREENNQDDAHTEETEAGTAQALALFKDQKQAIQLGSSDAARQFKRPRAGQPDQADEQPHRNEEEEEEQQEEEEEDEASGLHQ